ncbi:hypothetical protein H206_02590 [Candidatus Electrothrix aarhusensis]|uniref:Uncharacterized protein n=1 Tax=Candidatus Electrothrix aarhusensis TaxID=1859131 RepID=A0A444ISG5_9BACT|nr:hypothetical protein H206_02590 [Candidatus Electrothrix aarhusensis]
MANKKQPEEIEQDIVGFNNYYGIDLEVFAKHAAERAVIESALSGFFKRLGYEQVPLYELDERLRELAVQYNELLLRLERQIVATCETNKVPPEEQGQLMAAVMGLIENQSKSLDIIKQFGGSTMGDTYNIHGGQVGAIGKSAAATGNTFQQIVSDLSRLHDEMQNKAATPEQQAATQDIAKAKQAAEQGDKPTMQQHLKNAGQWAVDCAQKVGTDVLAEYLKKLTLGM